MIRNRFSWTRTLVTMRQTIETLRTETLRVSKSRNCSIEIIICKTRYKIRSFLLSTHVNESSKTHLLLRAIEERKKEKLNKFKLDSLSWKARRPPLIFSNWLSIHNRYFRRDHLSVFQHFELAVMSRSCNWCFDQYLRFDISFLACALYFYSKKGIFLKENLFSHFFHEWIIFSFLAALKCAFSFVFFHFEFSSTLISRFD